MSKPDDPLAPAPAALPKAATGIEGFDEITGGGLPRGRPTLVAGGPGCGKTMLAAHFLVHGARHGEPGVFVTFEESADELALNLRSLGIDLDDLQRRRALAVDHVHIERSEIEETGEYDLEGLFIRLGHAIDSVGAKRIVLDTLEALFAGLPNHAVLRAELRRLFRWLKDRGMTALITGERGETSLTRYGLEEYVADCVIVLDHRIVEQVSTRRMRVVKYRGSAHGTNEYPFLIDRGGLSVLPITAMGLDHEARHERVSAGHPGLDEMLAGEGFFRGSSVLVSGPPGSGKSSLGALFAEAACGRGERALLFVFEESASQLCRNMGSIGVDLARRECEGLLRIHASRPTRFGIEQHLLLMHDLVAEFDPSVVIVDPISNLTLERSDALLKPALMRLVDLLKRRGATALFTSLTGDGEAMLARPDLGVSSMMDTWLVLTHRERDGRRVREIRVVKSRGMAHASEAREFVFGGRGIEMTPR